MINNNNNYTILEIPKRFYKKKTYYTKYDKDVIYISKYTYDFNVKCWKYLLVSSTMPLDARATSYIHTSSLRCEITECGEAVITKEEYDSRLVALELSR